MDKTISLQDLIAEVQKEFPKFEIVKKKDSFLMKAIDIFLKVITFGKVKSFMLDFITTIGYKIYVPLGWELMDRVAILCHERVHMRQANKYGRLWFSFSYLFLWTPTIFAYFRKKYEQEAYEETLRYTAKIGEIQYIENKLYRENIIKQFTTVQYFWTWPFRKSIEAWYDATVEKIRTELKA
jgi:hypothetical protein